MRLDALVAEARLERARIVGDAGVEVTSITHDSRSAGPGSLFACVRGATTDGHDHAPAAVASGAVALVSDRVVDVAAPQVVVDDVRAALGPLADALWGHPSRDLRVVGVTGTNGKTTTVALLAAVFESHGWRTATIGTLTQARTTPEAPQLQARLAEMRDGGVSTVAMEVSSHALVQHRVAAVAFDAAVFTNLTQDHLDYHGDMDSYFEAKARLFEPGVAAVAVINGDDPWGRRLVERVEASGRKPLVYRRSDAHDLEVKPAGSTFTWSGKRISLNLGGRFNVDNALAAATTAGALGVPLDHIAAGLSSAGAVRGRFQAIDAGQDFTVIVDYAHTPDGLRQALSAARELTAGRLIVVFGAGGERDQAKRPLMGQVASALADLVVVTSDNPRRENPQAIIDSIVSAATGPGAVQQVADRAEAIRTALSVAAPGDVVVVAGKGHETGQEIDGRVLPFDDASEMRRQMARILGSRDRGAK
jgi:UDP-N-acetylmuramoyl-L-alanyl-D-glutamate--2,6-diaminopimelate ligase